MQTSQYHFAQLTRPYNGESLENSFKSLAEQDFQIPYSSSSKPSTIQKFFKKTPWSSAEDTIEVVFRTSDNEVSSFLHVANQLGARVAPIHPITHALARISGVGYVEQERNYSLESALESQFEVTQHDAEKSGGLVVYRLDSEVVMHRPSWLVLQKQPYEKMSFHVAVAGLAPAVLDAYGKVLGLSKHFPIDKKSVESSIRFYDHAPL